MPPKSPLVHPREYFQNRSNPLRSGLVIVVLYAVATTVLMWIVVNQLLAQMENVPSGITDSMNELVSTAAVSNVVLLALSLLVIAAFMHYSCGGSDTDGSFEDAVAVAGWAYAPDLLELPVRYLLVRNTIADLEIDLENTEQAASAVQSLEGSFTLPTLLTSVVVVGWSVYILSNATAGSHNVDLQKTFLPAVIVGICALVFRLI
ncbi:YIP1 family protein [Natrinema zhouii]|uniref:YIP1 family protein n=1 Tax=Natrinema zhouii TaxID=1710539 RepID=A0A7D6H8H9_9EURY|nr:YIP1 family protein [Natrinema zhouii]QLK27428.1 YIP1 family protein [Natrinema zhouii]